VQVMEKEEATAPHWTKSREIVSGSRARASAIHAVLLTSAFSIGASPQDAKELPEAGLISASVDKLRPRHGSELGTDARWPPRNLCRSGSAR